MSELIEISDINLEKNPGLLAFIKQAKKFYKEQQGKEAESWGCIFSIYSNDDFEELEGIKGFLVNCFELKYIKMAIQYVIENPEKFVNNSVKGPKKKRIKKIISKNNN